jgi:integrase
MPSYLQKRRRRWYAVLDIPVSLRPVIGKPRFVKSLETDSLSTAQRLVHKVVAEWQEALTSARKEPKADRAKVLLTALRRATTEAERAAVLELIYEAADAIGAANVEHVGQRPSSDPAAQEFYGMATGALVGTMEHLEDWLLSCRGTSRTKEMQRNAVTRMAAQFPLVRDVDRAAARRWVTGLMAGEEGLSPKTVKKLLSGMRGYWRYLQTINVVVEGFEPFNKLELATSKRGVEAARQPFAPADVPKLVLAALARGDTELADLVRLGMWTGCRIEELCALKIADVTGDSFRVVSGKSAAAVRVVPVHVELAPVLARLIGKRVQGYVLDGLTTTKYGQRGNAVGKRFGAMRTELGYSPAYVFHSLRRTFVTALENAGVSENVVADMVGHNKPRITYGLYSGGATLSVKRAALALLSYP